MKITCDLCGGSLQINAGGKNASCTVCGMMHSIDRVREKLKENDTPANLVGPVDIVNPDDIIDASDIMDFTDTVEFIEQKEPVSMIQPFGIVEPVVILPPTDNTLQISIDKISSTFGKGLIVSGKIKNGCLLAASTIYVSKKPHLKGTVSSIKSKGKVVKKAEIGMPVELSIKGIKRKDITEFDILTDTQFRTGAPAVDAYAYKGTPEEYFASLLRGVFFQYEIIQNAVSPVADSAPISFMITKNQIPVLAIILCHSQDYKKKFIMNTVRACESKGVPVQRYYTNFRNNSDYVVERIQSVLN